MTQEQVYDCSLEWLRMLERGIVRNEARAALLLSQTIASMFDSDAWQKAQQRLIEL